MKSISQLILIPFFLFTTSFLFHTMILFFLFFLFSFQIQISFLLLYFSFLYYFSFFRIIVPSILGSFWSTSPTYFFVCPQTKVNNLTKLEETKCKHANSHKNNGSNSTYPEKAHIDRFFETQHGYELSSKHNVSTHVEKNKRNVHTWIT